ncbi:MAG: DUF1837 domain-containing protein [Anaerolineales bacterium]|nr:DUF1837 domain-containing protein [Anaerolineales bacterium]
MAEIPAHINWLVDTEERLTTSDGKVVEVWGFRHEPNEEILSAWAKHFREHYCLDEEIDFYRRGYGASRSEYLRKIKLPDELEAPGPSVRAGDFGEILVADYLEFVLGFWVPRARYGAKAINDESTKGCDTVGFMFINKDDESPNDTLAIYETKARLTGDNLTTDKKASGFQAAINDSAKDHLRIAFSLNYLKQRLFETNHFEQADLIDRFQNQNDHPYKQVFGAAVIYSTDSYNKNIIKTATSDRHPSKDVLRLIVITGENLKELVHSLYERAANEA